MTDLVSRLAPLEAGVNRAWWDASVTGEPAAFALLERLRNRMDDVLRDGDVYDRIVALDAAETGDPVADRVVRILRLEALPRQVDPELSRRMNALATAVEREVATWRPLFEGRPRTRNDLDRVLSEETDEDRLREAWEALRAIGARVADRLLELVELRNRAARDVGHADFRRLQLAMAEQDPDELDRTFDRLDRLTAAPFAEVKQEIDARLVERHGVPPEGLRPWHYGDAFFQKVPPSFAVDLDPVYADADPVAVARGFFTRLGLDVEPILARSSLYEAAGKDPHAFATDIDRAGDVRILLNVRPNERWMGTTLHELGHAVYDAGVDPDLPWALRRPAHILTTEGVAMLFGRLSRDAGWMREAGLLDDARAARIAPEVARSQRGLMLVSARWIQVMTRFEKALYEDPGRDLQEAWWSLVERFQGLARPGRPADAADWASKVHVVAAPVYYHNYLLGELFASQVRSRLAADTGVDDPLVEGGAEVGAWLTERVFRPGARFHYDDLARRVTGEPLGEAGFAREFIGA